MIAAAWLVRSGLLYSLQLQSGSFPKLLTQEEQKLLVRSAKGDLEARYQVLRFIGVCWLFDIADC